MPWFAMCGMGDGPARSRLPDIIRLVRLNGKGANSYTSEAFSSLRTVGRRRDPLKRPSYLGELRRSGLALKLLPVCSRPSLNLRWKSAELEHIIAVYLGLP